MMRTIAFLALASCTAARPPSEPLCQDSIEPVGFGFGSRCAPGAAMTYRAPPKEGPLDSPADPWAGGYIVCQCVR